MRKPLRLLLLVPACASLVLLGTGAETNEEQTTILERAINPGGIIKFAKKLPTRPDTPTDLPPPSDPPGAGQPLAGPKGFAMSASGAVGGFGSALVTPRGAPMASPKQQADREIRKLIRSLN